MRRASLASAPRTAWSREQWCELADHLLASVQPYASPTHAKITLPGRPGGYGSDVDGLEGFARTFLLAAFRVHGDRGHDPHRFLDWYAQGLAAGVDRHSPQRWVRLEEHPQAKVEAASLALGLDLTRDWMWDNLPGTVQEQVVDYLSHAVGDTTYPRINWVWFRLVVQTFLRSVGADWSPSDVEEDLATHDSFRRPGGWMADGHERAYDHYAGWALHLYPTIWSRMTGAADLAVGRGDRDTADLDRFLNDALHLVGADGSPLLQGRSLSYRFAAAAPFWVGAIAEVPSVSPGRLRHAAELVVGHFSHHGVPDQRGLLTLGWHHQWSPIAQAYSGPGSPYWAVKGFLGLTLPAEHPAWTTDPEPLPVEVDDFVIAAEAPGWIVSGTRADGIVRIANHGTDHAQEGDRAGDSPLYARLGYSTATCPLLDQDSWTSPLDQTAALLDAEGRATHRAGMRNLDVQVSDHDGHRVGLGISTGSTHWLDPDDAQAHHGSGYTGATTPAGTVTVASLVRGPWEVRLVRVGGPVHPAALQLQIAGWPVAGSDEIRASTDTATGTGPASNAAATVHGTVSSTVASLTGAAQAGVTRRHDASPLGSTAAVPWLRFPIDPTTWVAALLTLELEPTNPTARVALQTEHGRTRCVVTWPDGLTTRHDLDHAPPADA